MKHIFLTLLAIGTLAAAFSQPSTRIRIEGDATKILYWTGKNPREEAWYLDRDYRNRVKVIPTDNGAIVAMDHWNGDIEILRITVANRRDLEIGLYTYDFDSDGRPETFIAYSPKPGEAHMKVYYNITDERPWLIGNFHGLDKFILKGPLVFVPYEYFYEDYAYMHKYAYYDRDFYELVRHDPDPEETGK